MQNFDDETHEFFLDKGENPFVFERLRHTSSVDESKALNRHIGPAVIIAASGMCEAGRIRHHLRNSLDDPRNTILIVGYQGKHTLGRKLVEGHTAVKVFDEMIPVRATVKTLSGYSGHGDQNDLLENIQNTKGVQKIFLVHGDPEQREQFGDFLQEHNADWKIMMPERGERMSV